MSRQVKIPLEVLNHTLQYLANRPYIEVVDIITLIKTNSKELPDLEDREDDKEIETKKEKSDPVKANESKGKGFRGS